MDTDLLLELHKAKFPMKIWDNLGGIETFYIPTTEQLLKIIDPEEIYKLKTGKFFAAKGDKFATGLTKDSSLAKLWLQMKKK